MYFNIGIIFNKGRNWIADCLPKKQEPGYDGHTNNKRRPFEIKIKAKTVTYMQFVGFMFLINSS